MAHLRNETLNEITKFGIPAGFPINQFYYENERCNNKDNNGLARAFEQ